MHIEPEWVNLSHAASVTVSSGNGDENRCPGTWLANISGEQSITVQFHRPIAVRRIRIVFEELHVRRTQEFAIWASLHRGERHVEIVRQQFNFSPDGATREIEEYATDLNEVAALKIRIVPSIDGCAATAKLIDLRVA